MSDYTQLQDVFTRIYDGHGFGGRESVSGSGSDLENTVVLREELPKLLHELNVQSMIDAPCGDYHWMKELQLNLRSYLGVDIVRPLISANILNYAKHVNNSVVSFRVADITQHELPQADLILCRDCLVHLTFEQGRAALQNFKRTGSKWLLTTTFPDRDTNTEINPGDWRTVNLERWPYFLPKPERLINEGCMEGGGCYQDKALGLWRLN